MLHQILSFFRPSSPPAQVEEKLASGGRKAGKKPKILCLLVGMKTERIFSDRIRDRIRLEGF
jgi:hypothetical protein